MIVFLKKKKQFGPFTIIVFFLSSNKNKDNLFDIVEFITRVVDLFF
jgi:hypothetical protein